MSYCRLLGWWVGGRVGGQTDLLWAVEVGNGWVVDWMGGWVGGWVVYLPVRSNS